MGVGNFNYSSKPGGNKMGDGKMKGGMGGGKMGNYKMGSSGKGYSKRENETPRHEKSESMSEKKSEGEY